MTQDDSRRTALVVEGGAMRSVFSAGIFDGFLDKQFNPFDFGIGVSAGSYNLVNYMAGNRGLGLTMYLEAASNREFIDVRRFFLGGNLLDLNWLYMKLLDMPDTGACTDESFTSPMYAGVTSVNDGKPDYILLNHRNFATVIQASCALPLFYRKFPLVNNSPMVDGGIADGIPVQQAIKLGATRIMVIRSRAFNYKKRDTLWHKYIRWKLRAYPALAATMKMRLEIFDRTINLLRRPPEGIRIIEICPPATYSSGRFNRQYDQLKQGYQHGYEAASRAITDWENILTQA